MKKLKLFLVLIGYCITSTIYASQAQQKSKQAALGASGSSSSSAPAPDENQQSAAANVNAKAMASSSSSSSASVTVANQISAASSSCVAATAATAINAKSSSESTSSSSANIKTAAAKSSAVKSSFDKTIEQYLANTNDEPLNLLPVRVFHDQQEMKFAQAYGQCESNAQKALVYEAAIETLSVIARQYITEPTPKMIKACIDELNSKIALEGFKEEITTIMLSEKLEKLNTIYQERNKLHLLFDEHTHLYVRSLVGFNVRLEDLQKQRTLDDEISKLCYSDNNAPRVDELLAKGASPNSYSSRYCQTLMHSCFYYAVWNANEKIVKLLMKHNANPYMSHRPGMSCINDEKFIQELKRNIWHTNKNEISEKLICDLNKYVEEYTKLSGKHPLTITSPGDTDETNIRDKFDEELLTHFPIHFVNGCPVRFTQTYNQYKSNETYKMLIYEAAIETLNFILQKCMTARNYYNISLPFIALKTKIESEQFTKITTKNELQAKFDAAHKIYLDSSVKLWGFYPWKR